MYKTSCDICGKVFFRYKIGSCVAKMWSLMSGISPTNWIGMLSYIISHLFSRHTVSCARTQMCFQRSSYTFHAIVCLVRQIVSLPHGLSVSFGLWILSFWQSSWVFCHIAVSQVPFWNSRSTDMQMRLAHYYCHGEDEVKGIRVCGMQCGNLETCMVVGLIILSPPGSIHDSVLRALYVCTVERPCVHTKFSWYYAALWLLGL